MSLIIPKNNLIDELYLHKHQATEKMRQVMSKAQEYSSEKMVRTASANSIDQTGLLNLFTQMLSALNMTTNENSIKDMVSRIANTDGLDKQAAIDKNSKERRDDIKIVSKAIKDSHYQIDISKDIIKQNNQEVFMVSCYAKDAYLGRYLIKRNYFYTMDRATQADDAY